MPNYRAVVCPEGTLVSNILISRSFIPTYESFRNLFELAKTGTKFDKRNGDSVKSGLTILFFEDDARERCAYHDGNLFLLLLLCEVHLALHIFF